MTANEKAQILEDRLVALAVRISRVAEAISKDFCGAHYAKQFVRSGSAPALLHGEARGAESQADFKHKMSVALKELRETYINLRIIDLSGYISKSERMLDDIIEENSQLISIFVAAVRTVKAKLKAGHHG